MPLLRSLSGSSIVVAIQEQVSSDLAGESVILHLKSGVYYGLNDIGAQIWNLIQQPKTVRELRDSILQEYEVEPAQCESDLLALLQDLAAAELIEVKDEASA